MISKRGETILSFSYVRECSVKKNMRKENDILFF